MDVSEKKYEVKRLLKMILTEDEVLMRYNRRPPVISGSSSD